MQASIPAYTGRERSLLFKLRAQLRRIDTLIEHHLSAIERDMGDLYAYGYRAALLSERVFLLDILHELEKPGADHD